MSLQQKMYYALIKKYEAEIAEAEATLTIYFTTPVGIGEHPQHLEEMNKFVEKLANAKDKLETLTSLEKEIKQLNN
jgi:methylaspartate ammonia-lyase